MDKDFLARLRSADSEQQLRTLQIENAIQIEKIRGCIQLIKNELSKVTINSWVGLMK